MTCMRLSSKMEWSGKRVSESVGQLVSCVCVRAVLVDAVGFSRRVWVTIGERREGESVLNEVKGGREGGRKDEKGTRKGREEVKKVSAVNEWNGNDR